LRRHEPWDQTDVVSVITAALVRVVVATPRSRLLVLDVHDHPLTFSAGQAVLIAQQGEPDRRPYSIASSPHRTLETGELEVLIAVDEAGQAGPHLPRLAPDTRIDVEGPVGTFIFPEDFPGGHVLFVAGGTGIAPLRAMSDDLLLNRPDCHISLLYSARSHDEFAFIDEFRQHAHARRLDLHQTVTRDEGTAWIGGRGRIGQAHFEAVLHDPSATLCFVCGPTALVTESVGTLEGLGVPRRLIRTEAWLRRAPEHALES
jgi:benzoate/toluate 1,2-dioxygenase reductase subunit